MPCSGKGSLSSQESIIKPELEVGRLSHDSELTREVEYWVVARDKGPPRRGMVSSGKVANVRNHASESSAIRPLHSKSSGVVKIHDFVISGSRTEYVSAGMVSTIERGKEVLLLWQ